MTIEIGIAIENGAIGERFDNDPDFDFDFDLESPRSSVLHRNQNLTHLRRFFSLKDPSPSTPDPREPRIRGTIGV